MDSVAEYVKLFFWNVQNGLWEA